MSAMYNQRLLQHDLNIYLSVGVWFIYTISTNPPKFMQNREKYCQADLVSLSSIDLVQKYTSVFLVTVYFH